VKPLSYLPSPFPLRRGRGTKRDGVFNKTKEVRLINNSCILFITTGDTFS
jgi:hypothetical protein